MAHSPPLLGPCNRSAVRVALHRAFVSAARSREGPRHAALHRHQPRQHTRPGGFDAHQNQTACPLRPRSRAPTPCLEPFEHASLGAGVVRACRTQSPRVADPSANVSTTPNCSLLMPEVARAPVQCVESEPRARPADADAQVGSCWTVAAPPPRLGLDGASAAHCRPWPILWLSMILAAGLSSNCRGSYL